MTLNSHVSNLDTDIVDQFREDELRNDVENKFIDLLPENEIIITKKFHNNKCRKIWKEDSRKQKSIIDLLSMKNYCKGFVQDV